MFLKQRATRMTSAIDYSLSPCAWRWKTEDNI